MTDGARNALLGYVFQLSTVASLRACTAGVGIADLRDPAILAHVAGGTVRSEWFNQDAVIVPEGGQAREWVAIQVKHSEDQAEEIDLEDFAEIISGFERSRRLAIAAGYSLDKFYVITNRSLHTLVQSLWSPAQGREFEAALNSRRRQGQPPERLAKLLKNHNSEAEAFTAWHSVLAQLQPVLSLAPQSAYKRLDAYQRQHGMRPEERERGLKLLIGELVTESTGTTPIHVNDTFLKRHLLGAVDVRNATFDARTSFITAR